VKIIFVREIFSLESSNFCLIFFVQKLQDNKDETDLSVEYNLIKSSDRKPASP